MQQRSIDLSELMRAASRGDAVAYRALLKGLVPVVRAVVARGLARAGRGNDEIEDIVQETLLAIHLKRHTWDDRLPVEPWVRAIAHHKLVDALRRRGFRQTVPIDDNDDLPPSVQPSVEHGAGALTELLARLPERQRVIVQAMSIEGRTASEVGDMLGMKEGAVRVALHRALKALATAFGQDKP